MAIPQLRTPGVQVIEESRLPASVVEVASAIPAFVGYTAKHQGPGPIVAEVNSLLQFEEVFGKSPASPYTVKLDATGNPQLYWLNTEVLEPPPQGVTPPTPTEVLAPLSIRPAWLLWYSIDFYFRNGGGRCYVVSVGKADSATTITSAALIKGLSELEKQDEPTLIVIPEATRLKAADFKTVNEEALKHCNKMGDRFAILDVKEQKDAAPIQSDAQLVPIRQNYGADNLNYGAAYYPFLNTSIAEVVEEQSVKVITSLAGAASTADPVALNTLLTTNKTELYNKIKKLLADQRVTLPPSPAIAGSYVRVDFSRGVWKAPANIGLQSVISPVHLLTDELQGSFNVDPSTGKSINAIRSFTARGSVIWGARTLAGNDNEWRYVPVRRLFITIEESVKKATVFALYEPNDASSWFKVKGAIESYLYRLWEQGALQGSTPDKAYVVKVGLGITMTTQDILDGVMNIEIGIAAVRPAEFIFLRFSHLLAQA